MPAIQETSLERSAAAISSAMSLPLFIISILATRLILLALLFFLLGGHEISNDVAMHMDMVRSPLCVLTYGCPGYEQHPPFLPFMEAALGFPLSRIFSDFLTLRLVMIFFELVAGALFYLLLERLNFSAARKGLCLAGFLILPVGWMTTTVMSQDDSIGAVFFLLPVLLLLSGRIAAAILFCGLGVLAGKIFVALELLTLLAFCPRRKLLGYAALGFAPVFIVYRAMTVHRMLNGFPLPLVGFHPDPYFGATFWTPLRTYAGVDFSKFGPYTGVLALAAAIIPAYIVLQREIRFDEGSAVPVAVTASVLAFFSLFYHTEPEYLMLVFPLLILTVQSLEDTIFCLLLATVPWVTKLLQLVVFQVSKQSTGTGKASLLRVLKSIFHSSPDALLAATQIMFSVLTILYAAKLCVRLSKTPQSLRPINNRVGDLRPRTQ